MNNIPKILDAYGHLATESIRHDVQKISATGDTADSIRYEVTQKDDIDILKIYGRQFFKTIETGRGPRKSNQYQEFDEKILEYMQIKGIGNDLSNKKRKRLAKFIALKINKEGDSVYKKGGRQVYSDHLNEIMDQLKKAIAKDLRQSTVNTIKKLFKDEPNDSR